MRNLSIGDLSQSYQMRHHTFTLKQAIAQNTTEVTTGVTANLSRTLGGNFSPVAGVERALKALEGYRIATTEAATFVTGLQATLENIQGQASGVASGLLLAASSASADLIASSGADALQRFRAAIGSLNTRVADRSLLAGASTDGPAVASADAVLAALVAATAGETGTAGYEQAVDDWFADPTGFAAVAYQGSLIPLAPFQTGPAEEVSLDVSALDPDLQESLSALALAALLGNGAFAGNVSEQAHLARRAGERLLEADTSMVKLRALVGAVEGRIDEAATRNAAETTTLQLALNDIVGVDSYEAASALEQHQTQLETLFTITARLARLNLADLLR